MREDHFGKLNEFIQLFLLLLYCILLICKSYKLKQNNKDFVM